MKIRDRIRELRRVPAGELKPHPRNWRVHPDRQRDALRAVLAEIGYADALLARELPDGSLQLLDGHLRAETTPGMVVPVLIVDLDDAEAEKFLALCDPLAGLAEADTAVLSDLAGDIETQSPLLREVIADVLPREERQGESPAGGDSEPALPELYQVVVECDDEHQQQTLYERLTAEGYTCRVLVL